MQIKNIIWLLLGISNLSYAQSTESLIVQSQVADTCNMTAQNINFGVLDFINNRTGYASTTGKLNITCTKNTQYNIRLSWGISGQRQLLNETNYPLNYSLHSLKNPYGVWGDGTNGTYTVNNTATGYDETELVIAQIPYSQTPSAGNYSDTIIVTLDY